MTSLVRQLTCTRCGDSIGQHVEGEGPRLKCVKTPGYYEGAYQECSK